MSASAQDRGRAIGEAVGRRHEATVGLLQELIRRPSVNPWFQEAPELSGEGGVQELLAGRLADLGAELEWQQPDVAVLARRPGGARYAGRDFRGRSNLVARLPGEGAGLLLAGHADTVPAGPGWSVDPFAGVRQGGRIYGRGAVDMKGGMAAAVGALESLRAAGVALRGRVTVASLVDEEAGGTGIAAAVSAGLRAGAAIVPEATDLAVAPLCRGILWGEVEVRGRGGHIELRQAGWREGGAVDAIGLGQRLLAAVDDLNRRWSQDPRKRHPLLPLPCQVKPAMIRAGHSPTSYADRFVLTFDAQYLPSERDGEGLGGRVKAELEAWLSEWARGDEWLAAHPPRIRWLVDADCAETPASDPIVAAVRSAAIAAGAPGRLEGVTAHTDMGTLIDAGVPSVNFGPGSMGVAHQPDEQVSEDDLHRATLAIALAVAEVCG
jgi:acetylornithine deacetylase